MANPSNDEAKPKATLPKNTGVFDVAHPESGQLPNSTTSKPVLVSNRPVMQDPMMVADGKSEEVASSAPVLTPVRKKVIMPSEDFKVPEEAAEEPTAEEVPVKEEPVEEETPKSEEAKLEEPVITKESGEPVTVLEPEPKAGVPEAKREEKELGPDQIAEAEKASQEREEKMQQMIEKEEFFLPINAAQERRHRRFAIFGLLLIIVLAIAWYNIALDAGLLPNTYNLPHTSLFTIK